MRDTYGRVREQGRRALLVRRALALRRVDGAVFTPLIVLPGDEDPNRHIESRRGALEGF